ncbi:MAG: Crp/Fnr family transcriptional regulator [Gammaproteobacteria bacterium]|nr:Crp/Fnr family transcriptional regulator [Gammaproteobacteria bacterium]
MNPMDGDSNLRILSLLDQKNYIHLYPLDIREEIARHLKLMELYPGKDSNYSLSDEKIYFPINAVFALTAPLSDGASTLVRFLGARDSFGVRPLSPYGKIEYRIELACGGHALVMPDHKFWEIFSRALKKNEVVSFIYSIWVMTSFTNGTCAASHNSTQRLMRVLLSAQDAAPKKSGVHLTHEKLSKYLNCRRETVSDTLKYFCDLGAIEMTRGVIKIVDIEKCESLSCLCYRAIRDFDDKIYNDSRSILSEVKL